MEYGVLINVRNVPGKEGEKMAVGICPVTEDEGAENMTVSNNQILKTLMHGLMVGIRNMEEDDPSMRGKVMAEVMNGLNELYVDTGMDSISNEKFERLAEEHKRQGTKPEDSGEHTGWEPPH